MRVSSYRVHEKTCRQSFPLYDPNKVCQSFSRDELLLSRFLPSGTTWSLKRYCIRVMLMPRAEGSLILSSPSPPSSVTPHQPLRPRLAVVPWLLPVTGRGQTQWRNVSHENGSAFV